MVFQWWFHMYCLILLKMKLFNNWFMLPPFQYDFYMLLINNVIDKWLIEHDLFSQQHLMRAFISILCHNLSLTFLFPNLRKETVTLIKKLKKDNFISTPFLWDTNNYRTIVLWQNPEIMNPLLWSRDIFLPENKIKEQERSQKVFSLRYSLKNMLNQTFNLQMNTIKAFFFQNQGDFFQFSKMGRLYLPPYPLLVSPLKKHPIITKSSLFFKSSPSQVLYKISALKSLTQFAGKHLYWILAFKGIFQRNIEHFLKKSI